MSASSSVPTPDPRAANGAHAGTMHHGDAAPVSRGARSDWATIRRLAWRFAWRDWTSGEIRVLALALVIAVASASAVGFFVDRLKGALTRDAAAMLGGDLVIASDRPIKPEISQIARDKGMKITETVSFPSMAQTDGDPDKAKVQLVSVKAVGDAYPLRGGLRVVFPDDAPVAAGATGKAAMPGRNADRNIASGTVWVDASLMTSLDLKLGDKLVLGDRTFALAGQIILEPDRGSGFSSLSPRVMLNKDDLPSTGLLGPGSRVTWRLMMIGAPDAVQAMSKQLTTELERGQRLESLESGRPEVRATLDRAEQFLALAALLSSLIAAVAVLLATRRFVTRRLDTVAVLRCLGASRGTLARLLTLEFAVVGVLACLVGAVLGFAAHFALIGMAEPLRLANLPAPGVMPAVLASVSGLLVLAGFAGPLLGRLGKVPALRVLRRDLGVPSVGAWLGWLAGFVAVLVMVGVAAREPKMAMVALLGFAVAAVVFVGVSFGLILLLKPLRHASRAMGRGALPWRFALAGLSRRPASVIAQMVALAVGLTALLLLTVVRGDLVEGWHRAAPADAPNRFVVNLQTDQIDTFQQAIVAAGMPKVPLYPMVRGRLIAINGKPVGPESYQDERAQRLVDREFNLSYMTDLPSHNQLVDGRWYGKVGAQSDQVSAEAGIMKTLGLKLGDTLRWDVAGETFDSQVTSTRSLRWDSMQVNFFMIMTPKLLGERPQTWISSFHMPAEKASLTRDLVRQFPNLSIIDMGAIVQQIQDILNRVVSAVEFLFGFTLAAGVLVLFAALSDSRDERIQEAVLLRAIGATSAQLRRAAVAELLLIGALAGVLAGAAASGVGWAVAEFALKIDWEFKPMLLAVGLAAGVVCALAGGWVALRGVLKASPMAQLRGLA